MKGKLFLSIGLAVLVLALGLLIWSVPPTTRASGETFLVNTASDAPDNNIGNCLCQTAGGGCSLRAAIQEANACSGAQTIRFNAPMVISPATALPALTDNGTVIDGSDRWLSSEGYDYPGVILYGRLNSFNGLEITASNCAVRGIQIVYFGQHGVQVYGGAKGNVIGGWGARQRNIISGNGCNGVRIEGATTTGNTVARNYIGTGPRGLNAVGNGCHGVSIWEGADNLVVENLISGNTWSGVAVDYVDSGLIGDNRIGLTVDDRALGNGFYGVHVTHDSAPNISYNEIAFNARGIHIDTASAPWIHHNTIYSNNASNAGTGSGRGGGIYCSIAQPLIVSNVITNNVAYTGTDRPGFGGGLYLLGCDGARLNDNTVVSNTANTVVEGRGGGLYVSDGDAIVSGNTIMSNTAGADISSRGGGLHLVRSDATVRNNTILGNVAAVGSRGFGGGLYLYHRNAIVDGNLIAGNSASYGNLESENSASFTVTNNIIVQNAGNGVYIWATEPSYGLLINNTIAHNSGSGIYLYNASLELDNTIVAFNSEYGLYLDGYVLIDWPNVRNDVWGNSAGPSNIHLDYYLTQDPRFFGVGQYALRAGSPCIDRGRGRISTSYNGLSRPQGAGHDIGAYEMAPPNYLPLVLRNF